MTSWAVREVASTGTATMLHDCLNLKNGKIRVLKGYAIYRLRAFSRLISAFHREQLPTLHFSALDTENTVLNPSFRLRRIFENFRHELPSGPDVQSAQARITRQFGILCRAEDHTRQAMSTWHSIMQRHSTQPLQPPAVCRIVEEMALALPDVAQGEPAWSPLDDTEETDSKGSSRDQAEVGLSNLAERVRHDSASCSKAMQGREQTPELQQEQMAALHKALGQKEGFRQKPFEWNYEGLKPLLLHEVLASRRGMSLSLCILFSCVASRLGLALMPVPTSALGYGNEQSILGVPDVPTWLLRHDGSMDGSETPAKQVDKTFWDPVSGRIIDSWQCLKAYPGFAGIAISGRQAILRVSTELLRTAIVAHQRRGDSDAVAHCFHQLLALDLTDPDWNVMLEAQTL